MRKLFCLLLLALTAASCGERGTNEESGLPRYNKYVDAFTSGNISRTRPVYLVFTKEVDEGRAVAENIAKHVKIKPSVAGEFTFDNNKTVVFRPSGEFQRGTEYTVTADVSAFFREAEGADRSFTFTFSTPPLNLRAELGSVKVNAENDELYDITVDVYTSDSEDAEVVEGIVEFSEKVTTQWTHADGGRRHTVLLENVPGGGDEPRTLDVRVGTNKFKVQKEDLLTVYIPIKGEFGVYDVSYVSNPEKYIAVTFTEDLDPDQDFDGMAWLSRNRNETVTVEDNVLKLYPDSDTEGYVDVYVSPSVRSASGKVLGGDNLRASIEVTKAVPSVKFIGSGLIIPDSEELKIPFQATYLRGVRVRVIRIHENNIGQFLQSNSLGGYGDEELMRVGRIVAYKTVWLDGEEDGDMNGTHTYALDLRKLVEPEQGAIYRVVLSFDRDLATYPCEGLVRKSKEEIEAQDYINFHNEIERFNDSDYHYYSDNWDFDWSEYNWRESDDPCKPAFYEDVAVARNILATNLGVMAKKGEADEMIALVHNITTTKPEAGVEVAVYNFQNQLLGTGTTDANGKATFRLGTGRPFYLKAAQGKQRAYLKLDPGSALSTSQFDVAGRTVEKGIKGFIYGDRGVWRPGDVLYLSFMLNDRTKTLPPNLPVVMELYNPAGQLVHRKTQTEGQMGLYAFELPTDPDAPTGAWSANVYVGGVTFTKRVRVEAIKPNRLKINLDFSRKVLIADKPVEGSLHVEWLQGAVARNLEYEIDGTFAPMRTSFAGFNGFVFDDPAKEFSVEESSVASGTTDEKGDAEIFEDIGVGSSAPGMLMASLVTRVYEESGDFSLDGMQIAYSPYHRYVGVRSPQSSEEQLATGKSHTFEVASVDYEGRAVQGTDLRVVVYKVNWYWWWSSSNGRLANYISDSSNRPVKTINVKTGADGKATFSLSFPDDEWGTYLIRVIDTEGDHSTGTTAYFDWPNSWRRESEGSDAPNKLTFTTDKQDYKPGETMTLTIPSSEGSRAVVSIENGSRVVSVSEYECGRGETTVQVPITAEMQPNVYVHVTLLQPHGLTQNDLPIRMYGVVPVMVTSPGSRITPEIKMVDEIKPEEKYELTVSEKDGRPMAYTLAIVDEGLLDLTRFATPDPWGTFNAREALGVETWDLYNHIIGAYGGRIEQLFSIGGGEEADAGGPKAIVNRFKPVVQFAGPFMLGKGEKRKHSYTMPNYNGRVRVMVVAGTGEAYGNAQKSVMVRKPVMVLGTLPRVIGVGEEMSVPATVFATQDGIGKVDVTITCTDNMEIVGSSKQTLNFTGIGDKQATFRIRVKSQPGAGRVVLTASGKGDKSTYETDIEIRSVRREQVKVTPVTLAAGQTWKQPVALPGADGTNSLTLEISDIPPINLSSRLGYLIGYPHGCIEQITSKAFPQLYVGQFAKLSTEQTRIANEAVKETIRRYGAYQIGGGGFAYWPGGTSSNAWGSIYATHFMLEAEGKGYLVPQAMKSSALSHLRTVARAWNTREAKYMRSEQSTQAYRLYVLALGGMQEVGAMNRLRESKSLADAARWMLAAAYAHIGRVDVAKELVQSTTPIGDNYDYEYDLTYGSPLRDRSVKLLALTLMGDSAEAAETIKGISEELSSDHWLSTQSTAFSLVALSKYMARWKVSDTMKFEYAYGGARSEKVETETNIWTGVLLEGGAAKAQQLEIRNSGQATMFARIITTGTPAQGEEEAYSNRVTMSVSYLDASERPLDVASLEQGTNLTAVVKVSNPTSKTMRNIVLTQVFPAGWEILSTRWMNDGADDRTEDGISYQDIRDDRVYTYIDVLPAGRNVTVKLNLAAVYSGRYYLPPVWVEAMYDNLTRANSEGRMVEVK